MSVKADFSAQSMYINQEIEQNILYFKNNYDAKKKELAELKQQIN